MNPVEIHFYSHEPPLNFQYLPVQMKGPLEQLGEKSERWFL